MKVNKFYLLIILLFSSLFFSCKENDDRYYYLDSGWTYNTISKYDTYEQIDIEQFDQLSKLCENRKGYIYLKNNFTVPDNLKDEVIGIYFGKIYLVHEVYINGCIIGGKGNFPPSNFYEGAQTYSYTIPSALLNEGENTIMIKMWVNGFGRIGETPVISTAKNITVKQRRGNFINSRVYLISSYLVFIIFLIYFFLYHLIRKEKSNYSFSLLTLFTSFYLSNLCLGEYPIPIDRFFNLLIFEKIFNGVVPTGTIYFAVSFIRDFLLRKDTKGRTIYRLIITSISAIITLIPDNMELFFKAQFIMYTLGAIQIFYAVRLIIEEIIKKSKRVGILLIGFSPVLLALVVELIIITFKLKISLLIIVLSWQLVILLFLGILIYNFAQMSKKNEYLNNNLEKIVEERTSELTFTNKLLEKTNFNLEYEKKRAEKEIELASFVQQSFYRHNIPVIDDWEIAFYSQALAGVSGDLYDFYTHQNILDGLGIFDVSGHGISSGLVTMLVKNIIQQEFVLGENDDLSEVMNKINDRVIKEKGNIENYLTGILIRMKENYIELVNAGHPQPILYKAKDNFSDIYENENQNRYGVIGISDFPIRFDSVQINLEHNDEILLYTDGILDCKNENKDDFGKTRLLSSFQKNIQNNNIADQVQGIINDLKNFMGNSLLNDDITLVILKKK